MRPNVLIGGLLALHATTSFAEADLWADNFGYADGKWEPEHKPLVLADVNADQRVDIVSFGDAGVYVSLSTGGGFDSPTLWLADFGYEAGDWRVDKHLRVVADVNADDRADVVGFGTSGVYVSLSTGSKFAPAELWLQNFAYEAGNWRVQRHPRYLADVNADGRADVVGFGKAGIYVALSTGTGFSPAKLWVDLKDNDGDD